MPTGRSNSEPSPVDVQIIIVNWNTKAHLRACLESIYRETRHVAFSVHVVDNASQDGSPEMIEREFPEVDLIANSTNVGFAAANNIVLRRISAQYALLLNPDAKILDGTVQKTIAIMESHPRAATLGCRVMEGGDRVQPTCFEFPSPLNILSVSLGLSKLFPRSRVFGRERLGWWNRDTFRKVDVVSGMYMLTRKEAIDEVGILDERFFVYGEETDWCYRFGNAGWDRIFTPDAAIIHTDGGGKSTSQIRKLMFVQLQKSNLLFLRKHRGRTAYLLGRAFYALGMSVRAAVWGFKGIVLGRRAALADAQCAAAALAFHVFGLFPRRPEDASPRLAQDNS